MSAYQLVLLLVLVVLIAAAVVLFLTQRSRTHPRPPADRQFTGPRFRDDDRYWLLGGFIYNNPDDPALFVINRWGIGITVNLGHPQGTLVAVGILLLLALLAILPILFLGPNSSSGCHPSSGCHLP